MKASNETDDGYVLCPIPGCGKKYQRLGRHIKAEHHMTFEEFKQKYPDAKLMTDECRERISKKVEISRTKDLEKYHDDKRKGGIASVKAQRNPPSELECYVIAIIQKSELPIQYTGNAGKDFIFGSRTPDFTSMTNRDFIISIFGDYWHSEEDVANEIAHYKKYGYSCHILWEHEIKKMSDDELLKWLENVTYNTK